MKIECIGFAILGTASFAGSIVLWGDSPPDIGQHLLPLSGMCWVFALARYLAPNRRLVAACGLVYLLLVAPAAYAGAVVQGTHVIYASLCYFAMTAAGGVLLVHAYRLATPLVRAVLTWRVVAILLLLLTLDALRYAIVLLVRWLGGVR